MQPYPPRKSGGQAPPDVVYNDHGMEPEFFGVNPMVEFPFLIFVNNQVQAGFMVEDAAKEFVAGLCGVVEIGTDISLSQNGKEILGFGTDGNQR